jgi:hypothetical protein
MFSLDKLPLALVIRVTAYASTRTRILRGQSALDYDRRKSASDPRYIRAFLNQSA